MNCTSIPLIAGVLQRVTMIVVVSLRCAHLADSDEQRAGGADSNDTCWRSNPAIDVQVSWLFACSLHADGRVACWGVLSLDEPLHFSLALYMPGIDNAVSLDAERASACAVDAAGTVQCWGEIPAGLRSPALSEPGPDGLAAEDFAADPVQVEGIDDAVAVSVGGLHACALRRDGRVSCWGRNDDGELGISGMPLSLVPVEVPLMDRAVAVAAHRSYTDVLLADGSILCWGLCPQVGECERDGGPDVVRVNGADLVAVGRVPDAVRLHDNYPTSWIIDADGRVFGRSCNYFGELGDGTRTPRTVPTRVPFDGAIVDVWQGTDATYGVTREGDLITWGSSEASGYLPEPFVPVSDIHDATAIGGMANVACVVRASGSVWCWGHNVMGTVGIDTIVDEVEQPVEVTCP